MRYVLLIISLIVVVVVLAVVGLFTPVGRGIVGDTFDSEVNPIIEPTNLLPVGDGVSGEAVVTFEPDVIRVGVDSIIPILSEDGAQEDGAYIAVVTELTETGGGTDKRFDMFVDRSSLGSAYISLEVGNIAQVAVGSIADFEPPTLPVLYPIDIIIEE